MGRLAGKRAHHHDYYYYYYYYGRASDTKKKGQRVPFLLFCQRLSQKFTAGNPLSSTSSRNIDV